MFKRKKELIYETQISLLKKRKSPSFIDPKSPSFIDPKCTFCNRVMQAWSCLDNWEVKVCDVCNDICEAFDPLQPGYSCLTCNNDVHALCIKDMKKKKLKKDPYHIYLKLHDYISSDEITVKNFHCGTENRSSTISAICLLPTASPHMND